MSERSFVPPLQAINPAFFGFVNARMLVLDKHPDSTLPGKQYGTHHRQICSRFSEVTQCASPF